MGEAAVQGNVRSVLGKSGAHYNIFAFHDPEAGWRELREVFQDPEKDVDNMNLVVFSTSGVHGMYTTIEEIEAGLRKYPDGPPETEDDGCWPDDYYGDELTTTIYQPRICCLRYGRVRVTLERVPYLKELRRRSWEVFQQIGRHYD